MYAYNLFRRKGYHDVFCAVPEDCAVPAFLRGAAWEFRGKVDESSPAPVDFDAKAAVTAVRSNCSYFFEPPSVR